MGINSMGNSSSACCPCCINNTYISTCISCGARPSTQAHTATRPCSCGEGCCCSSQCRCGQQRQPRGAAGLWPERGTADATAEPAAERAAERGDAAGELQYVCMCSCMCCLCACRGWLLLELLCARAVVWVAQFITAVLLSWGYHSTTCCMTCTRSADYFKLVRGAAPHTMWKPPCLCLACVPAACCAAGCQGQGGSGAGPGGWH